MKRKMPEKTFVNILRVVLVIPFIFLLACNAFADTIVTGLTLLIGKVFDSLFKVISYCIKSCILVIAGPILSDTLLDGLKD